MTLTTHIYRRVINNYMNQQVGITQTINQETSWGSAGELVSTNIGWRAGAWLFPACLVRLPVAKSFFGRCMSSLNFWTSLYLYTNLKYNLLISTFWMGQTEHSRRFMRQCLQFGRAHLLWGPSAQDLPWNWHFFRRFTANLRYFPLKNF